MPRAAPLCGISGGPAAPLTMQRPYGSFCAPIPPPAKAGWPVPKWQYARRRLGAVADSAVGRMFPGGQRGQQR